MILTDAETNVILTPHQCRINSKTKIYIKSIIFSSFTDDDDDDILC